MANVPYSPVPGVAPSPNEGGSYLSAAGATPNAFGAEQAQAGENLDRAGQVASTDMAEAAYRMGALNAQRDAQNALGDFTTQAANLNAKYRTLTGQAAVDGFPQLQTDLSSLRDKTAQSLGSPYAQQQFMESARFLESRLAISNSEYAATQQKQSWVASQHANVDTMTTLGVQMSDDPAVISAGANSIRNSMAELGKLNGWSDEVLTNQQTAATGRYYRAIIDHMLESDPVHGASRASALFNNVKGQMDAQSILQTEQGLRTSVEHAQVADGAVAALGSVQSAAPNVPSNVPPAPLSAIRTAIVGTEGSGPSAVNARTSASGIYQITPGLFQTYAQPGESFASEADRETVAERALADYSQKYNGDPSRVAVAWFSGPGNVAPVGSPTPWIRNSNDGNMTVSAYVGSVLQKVGAAPSTHDPMAYSAEAQLLQNARDEAQKRFPDRPDLQRQMVNMVYGQIQQTNTLQAKYEAEQKKELQDKQEAAGQAVVKQLMTDPSHFDPATIANDPSLTYQQKEGLWKMAQAHLADTGSHDVKTYGPGFYDLYSRVHAPQGDPNRITDPSQLYQHVGPNGDLTVAGVEKLTQEIQGKRTADGEAEATMRKNFLDMAKHQISGADPMLHIRDPKGDELYLKFLAQVLPQYDKERAAGASPADLLDPSSPKYLGKNISTFKRSLAQQTQDMLNDNQPPGSNGSQVGTNSGALDLNSQQGIVAAYRTGRINRQQASDALVRGGFAAAPGPTGVQAPSDER